MSWPLTTIRGTLLAVADDAGTKIGSTYRYPDGMPITGTTQPDLQPAAWERGWFGAHNRMTDTTDTAFPVIDMGTRPYAPAVGRFLSVDPVEDCVGPSDYLYPPDPINQNDLNGRACLLAWPSKWGGGCLGAKTAKDAAVQTNEFIASALNQSTVSAMVCFGACGTFAVQFDHVKNKWLITPSIAVGCVGLLAGGGVGKTNKPYSKRGCDQKMISIMWFTVLRAFEKWRAPMLPNGNIDDMEVQEDCLLAQQSVK